MLMFGKDTPRGIDTVSICIRCVCDASSAKRIKYKIREERQFVPMYPTDPEFISDLKSVSNRRQSGCRGCREPFRELNAIRQRNGLHPLPKHLEKLASLSWLGCRGGLGGFYGQPAAQQGPARENAKIRCETK